MSDKPVAKVRRLLTKYTVWPNRIERVKPGLFLIFKQRMSIPMRNVASVHVKGAFQVLIIETNGGEKYKWRVGGFGGANKLRDAILNSLDF